MFSPYIEDAGWRGGISKTEWESRYLQQEIGSGRDLKRAEKLLDSLHQKIPWRKNT